MPTYLYKCASHGVREITRRVEDVKHAVYCVHCVEENVADGRWEMGVPMTRVWSVPNLIVRPHGYHLRPGDRGYWDIDRAAEVSRIPSPDEHSNLGAGAPSDDELEADEYRGVPFPQPSEDGMQKLHEVARATFSESGSRL